MDSKKVYTFSDVWYAIQHHRQFNYAFWMDILLQIIWGHISHGLGHAFVVLALVLITSLGYGGLFYTIPSLADPGTVTHAIMCVVGVFFLYAIYFNYLFAVFTPAGSPPLPSNEGGDMDGYTFAGEDAPVVQTSQSASTSGYRTCKKCSAEKPPRCHHCSQCGSCILKFDHHCPWINNCVGLNNYRYFVSFLFWTFVGTLYLWLLCTPSVYSGSIIAADRMVTHGAHHSMLPLSDVGNVGAAEGTGDHLQQLRGADQAVAAAAGIQGQPLSQGGNIETKPKHGLAAMYEGFQMLRLLLFSSDESRGSVTNRLRAGEGGHRRTAAMPESGQDIPSLPIPRAKPGLRGSAVNRGGYELHRLSPIDILFKPDKFNQLVSLFPMDNVAVFIIFVITMSVHIGVAILFFFHAYLVTTGQTTLEFNMNYHKPAGETNGRRVATMYDRGSWRENFEEVFGPYPVWWALLPSTRGVHNSEEYCQAQGSFSRNRARVDTGYGNLLDV